MSVPKVFPDHVAVVGGGRWARVVVSILADLLPSSAQISVHSPHNAQHMRDWYDSQHFAQAARVTTGLPERLGSQSAAIIVNAAADHFDSAIQTLHAGMPTLIEKPVTLSLAATQELVRRADSCGAFLGSAQVFMFAEYFSNFLSALPPSKTIDQLRLEWRDEQSEPRHGEAKSYDAGLPVFADCMPHAVAILGRFAEIASLEFKSVHLKRGGAKLSLDFQLENKALNILFERCAPKRVRKLTIAADNGTHILDFSKEPGIIEAPDGKTSPAMTDWGRADSPMRLMISAFLERARGGDEDQRLGMTNALISSRLSDEILPAYLHAQKNWLFEHLSQGATSDLRGLEYAHAEITHAANGHADADRRVQNLHKFTRACAECDPGSDSGRRKLGDLIAALYGSVGN